MARQTKPLSAKESDVAKPKQSDYVLYDGDGLELLVKSNGSKLGHFATFALSIKRELKMPLALLIHVVTALKQEHCSLNI